MVNKKPPLKIESTSVPDFRILMCLGLPDPDPFVRRTDPDPSYHEAKIVRKTLIPTVLRLLYAFYF
jgi:hypothetical protein